MNMIKTISALAMALCVSIAAWAEPKDYCIEVGNFYELNVLNNLNVDYRFSTDSAGLAVFTAEPDVAHVLMFSNNKKGHLFVQVADENIPFDQLPRVTVYSSELTQVYNGSRGLISILSLRPATKFTARTSENGGIKIIGLEAEEVQLNISTGKGTITVSGTCEKLNCKNVGTGTIEARELEAHNINCTIVGTGHIYCNSTGGELNLKGTGSGKVHYLGTPSKIKVRKLGSIKAIPITD